MSILNNLRNLILIPYRLGFSNVFKVFIYRVKLRSGYLKFRMPVCLEYSQNTFSLDTTAFVPPSLSPSSLLVDRADQLLKGQHFFFNSLHKNLDSPPDWFKFYDQETHLHWTDTAVNSIPGSDIKLTWELSRFHWAPVLATAFVYTDDVKYLHTLLNWVEDWCVKNLENMGPNWTCAQESSIRLINLLNSLCILDQHTKPQKGFHDLISQHCCRIYPTLQYSIAQSNNHGILESIALVIGGFWLEENATGRHELLRARMFRRKGLVVLNYLLKRLVQPDGSFSMYSLNYHRVVLDAFSLLHIWSGLLLFEKYLPVKFYEIYRRMTAYFKVFLVGTNGDIPNFGANDGTTLLSSSLGDFRDFRTSFDLANHCSEIHDNVSSFGRKEARHILLSCFKLDSESKFIKDSESQSFSSSGCVAIKAPGVEVFMLYPNFKFRPSHSDSLHVDLWINGENLLRDSGTYSYNPCKIEDATYFSGTQGHNTIQFDSHDQMPKISRFLYGDWLKTNIFEPLVTEGFDQTFGAGYKDYLGCVHVRRIKLNSTSLGIKDQVSGFRSQAILRWRLRPGEWLLDGTRVSCAGVILQISSSVPIKRLELVKGWESRYYQQKTAVVVLEVEIDQPGELLTEIYWELL